MFTYVARLQRVLMLKFLEVKDDPVLVDEYLIQSQERKDLGKLYI
jgi:hypothetical protein